MPGGLGYFLRKKFYPRLFKKFGRGIIIGRNVVFRHPHKIELGDFVTIDDYCLIDGRAGDEVGVVFGDSVLISRNCMIIAKVGTIKLGKRVSLGANSVIVSMAGVEIGEAVLTAGHFSISAGLFNFDDINIPVMDQAAYSKGPIRIGKYSWFGTGVTILDGVNIGDAVVVGASSMVNKDIPDYSIAIGIPAKVVKSRKLEA